MAAAKWLAGTVKREGFLEGGVKFKKKMKERKKHYWLFFHLTTLHQPWGLLSGNFPIWRAPHCTGRAERRGQEDSDSVLRLVGLTVTPPASVFSLVSRRRLSVKTSLEKYLYSTLLFRGDFALWFHPAGASSDWSRQESSDRSESEALPFGWRGKEHPKKSTSLRWMRWPRF